MQLNIKPRKRICVIEVAKEQNPSRGGILLSRPDSSNFDKAKVLRVGPEVEDVKEGDVVYVHHGQWEPLIIGGEVGLVAEAEIFAIEETKSDN